VSERTRSSLPEPHSPSVPAGVFIAGGRLRRRRRRARGKVLLGCALLLGAAAYFGGGQLLDEALRIRSIEVTMNGPGALSEEEVRDLLGVVPGASLHCVSIERLRGRLLALPRVADVHIAYVWFQRLTVAVDERAAVAMVCLTDGGRFEVASDGFVLEPLGPEAADLPVLTWEADGLEPGASLAAGRRIDLHGAPDLLPLLRKIQSGQPSLWSGISEAHLLADGTYELYWIDCPTVVWGRGPLSDARLRAWSTIMTDLRERGENDAVVDLRFREQIVVRLPEEATEGPAPLG